MYDGNNYEYEKDDIGFDKKTYSYDDVSIPPPVVSELEPIWGTGTYHTSDGKKGFKMNKGSADKVSIAYKFKAKVTISKVIFISYQLRDRVYFRTGKSTFNAKYGINGSFRSFETGEDTSYYNELEITDPEMAIATDLTIFRKWGKTNFEVAKVIVLGEECSIAPFATKNWS